MAWPPQGAPNSVAPKSSRCPPGARANSERTAAAEVAPTERLSAKMPRCRVAETVRLRMHRPMLRCGCRGAVRHVAKGN